MSPTRVLVLILAVVSGSLHAAAQTSPKPADSPASTAPAAQTPPKPAESTSAKTPTAQPAEPESDESGLEDKPGPGRASASGKRGACRNQAKAKGLKGLERVDSMELCVAQARVDCVKEAIAKKMPRKERGAFFKSCMNQ